MGELASALPLTLPDMEDPTLMLHGYDVAAYQPGIDWPAVTADFIIAKATESTGWVDKLFGSHVVGALGRGIPWGGYHFAHPPQNQPEDEAAHFVRTCSTGQIVPCLDVEKYGANSSVDPLAIMGADRLAEWCDRWAVYVHDALGQTPLFYSYRSLMSAVAPRLSGPWAGAWLATATQKPDGAYLGRTYGNLRVLIEQYGSPSGEPGFSTAVDCNVADDSVVANQGDDMPTPADIWGYETGGPNGKPPQKMADLLWYTHDDLATLAEKVAELEAKLDKIGTASTGGVTGDVAVTGTLHLGG